MRVRGCRHRAVDGKGSGPWPAVRGFFLRLHRRVADIAGHATADLLVERLRAQVVRHQFMLSLVPGRAHVSLPQHQRIIDAIAVGDPAEAEAAMRDHVASVVEALRALEAARRRAGQGAGPGRDVPGGSSHQSHAGPAFRAALLAQAISIFPVGVRGRTSVRTTERGTL
ncbi:FCD domain-containing protein [Streptomyces sp. NPDC057474]|uniref:FCD domain-containing protein n=1 Tax=Streptomyces sp. NPDC057474 TaxID=3346144 RepID=UPI0036B7E04E